MNQFQVMTVNEIKDYIGRLSVHQYSDHISQLQDDRRVAVQKMGATLNKKLNAINVETVRIKSMKSIEASYYKEGFQFIGGIDEVGRGPLAGPVLVCTIILKPESGRLYVNDSKKLTKSKREILTEELLEDALDYAVGVVDNQIIDEINILNATKMAMVNSINQLALKPELLLIDALQLETDIPQKAIIHGDATCYAIAAASIVAKVYRDNLMEVFHEEYPEYGFNQNMGYGTAAHIEALRKYGPTPIHRRSFIQNLGV
jgi:ribonuclease HII